jgi:hypothetical protein
MRGARKSVTSYLVIAALHLACFPAFAQRIQDPDTGFSVNPPAPFKAEQTSNRRQFDFGVGISSKTGSPTPGGTTPFVCEVGFKAAPQNADLSIREINRLTDSPERQKSVRSIIETLFSISHQRTFTLQGVRGIELRGQPKIGPGADNARMMMSIVETPKGRVTLVCITKLNEIDAAMPRFRAIRNTITLPK